MCVSVRYMFIGLRGFARGAQYIICPGNININNMIRLRGGEPSPDYCFPIFSRKNLILHPFIPLWYVINTIITL